MYSLFIADDNPLIINGLKKLPFSELSVELKGICQNGSDAARFISENNPDIVITDIEMPGLNGIELIRSCVKSGVTSKFIILSGHDEFSFAQEAISLGVIDYLLKPVIPSQLVSSLKKAVSMLDTEAAARKKTSDADQLLESTVPIIRDSFMDDLFHGRQYSEQEFIEKCKLLSLPLHQKSFRCVSVKINDYPIFISKHSADEANSILASVLSQTEKTFPKSCHRAFREGTAYVLLYFTPEQDLSDEELTDLLGKLALNLQTLYGISVFFGVSSSAAGFKAIPAIYTEAKHCLHFGTTFTNVPIILYHNIANFDAEHDLIQIFDRKKFESYLVSKDYQLAQFYVESVLKNIESGGIGDLKYAKIISIEIYCKLYESVYRTSGLDTESFDIPDSISFINSIESFERLHLFFERVFNGIKNITNDSVHKSNEKLVQAAIAYTKIHYAENLTLQQLADIFSVSSTHLRRIFFKHTSMSYKDYLTKLRMTEAHALLATGNYKVYEVAYKVGYKKVDYFSKLYKQYFGTTPTQQ